MHKALKVMSGAAVLTDVGIEPPLWLVVASSRGQARMADARRRRSLPDGRAATGIERLLGSCRAAVGIVALPGKESDVPRAVLVDLRRAARSAPGSAHGTGMVGVVC